MPGNPTQCPTPLHDPGEPSSPGLMMELYRAETENDEGIPPERFLEEYPADFNDYQPLIASFGDVLVEYETGEYSGDVFALVRRGALYGIIVFGWGSCSGCDALQECKSWEDIAALRDDLARGIRWFESASDTLAYLRAHDWSLDWTWPMMKPSLMRTAWITPSPMKLRAQHQTFVERSFLDEAEAALVDAIEDKARGRK